MDAVVTLLTSADFIPGAKVLAHSIRRARHQLKASLVLLIVKDLVDHDELYQLGFDEVIVVDPIPNPNPSHVASWVRCGFTKLRIWQLNEFGYDRVLYIDADCAIVDRELNLDAEFDRLNRVDFAAAPDFFPPDRFNAGVILIRCDREMFSRLIRGACNVASYDGGDTGYLNVMFPDWYLGSDSSARLPFGMNAQRAMRTFTRRAPAYWRSVKVRILHYSSHPKPWERPLQTPDRLDFQCHDDPDEIFAKLFADSCRHSYPVSKARIRPRLHRCMTLFGKSAALPSKFTTPSNIKFGRYGSDDQKWLMKFADVYKKLIDEERHPSSPSIPLLIHQIWLGDQPIPTQFLEWANSLRRLNSSFHYKLWRDDDVCGLNLVRRSLYEDAVTPVQRSDILRWELLYQFGGVYADLDVECVAPLGPLLDQFHMIIGLGNTGHVEIMNSFVAAIPGHPVVLSCLNALYIDQRVDIMESTGPGAVTRTIGNAQLDDLISGRVAIMPVHLLYPLPNKMRFLMTPEDLGLFIVLGETFVLHHWSCSWQLPTLPILSEETQSNNDLRKIMQRRSLQDLQCVYALVTNFL